MIRILQGDCRDVLRTLDAGSAQCCVTSPPYYGLRDYGVEGQIGLETTPDAYVAELVAVFREVRRVLRNDGTLWLNLGDSYANDGRWGGSSGGKHVTALHGNSGVGRGKRDTGLKPKDLIGIPWMVAFALRADGWHLRSDIIWAKKNCMPESVTDRPSSAHEHVFLLTKSARYFYDAEAIREEGVIPAGTRAAKGSNVRSELKDVNGRPPEYWNYTGTRNARNVWSIATQPFSEWQDSVALVPVQVSEVPELGASDNALGGDMARITSPDCSLHGGQPDRVPMGFCDGLSADQLTHIRDNNRHPAQRKPSGSGSTRQTPVLGQPHPSTNCYSRLGGSEIATKSSKQSRKTGRDPAFSLRAILFEGNPSDTPHTEQSGLQNASISHDTGGNKILANTQVSSSAPETASGSVCSSELGSSVSCRCGYYRKVVSKTSHFATFPPELAERCIKAGSSEAGCCAVCGAPLERILERVDTGRKQKMTDGRDTGPGGHGTIHRAGREKGEAGVPVMANVTTGWQRTCECKAPVAPCVVLDPFGGAGTTSLVADRLGRDAILIELNADYATMATRRVTNDAGMFAEVMA